MRTQNPQSIRKDFDKALGEVDSTAANAEGSNLAVAEKKLVAGYSFLAAATLWEAYLSDLFVAYLNRDNESFRKHLAGLLKIEKPGDPLAQRALKLAVVSLPAHLSVAKIRAVLDSREFNITFGSVADLKKRAGLWLATADKARFKLSPQHSAGLEAIRALRNQLAHRSSAARTTMQGALKDVNLDPDLRRGANEIDDIGAFLRAKSNGRPRLSHYMNLLKALAHTTCP